MNTVLRRRAAAFLHQDDDRLARVLHIGATWRIRRIDLFAAALRAIARPTVA